MATEPAVTPPKHPVYALTTSELTGRRRELEHAIESYDRRPSGVPTLADLRRALLEVLAEQDERSRIARA